MAGGTADLTLGLRPLGLPPGSQGSAARLIVIRFRFRICGAYTAAAAAEIADARGPGVKFTAIVYAFLHAKGVVSGAISCKDPGGE